MFFNSMGPIFIHVLELHKYGSCGALKYMSRNAAHRYKPKVKCGLLVFRLDSIRTTYYCKIFFNRQYELTSGKQAAILFKLYFCKP